MNSLADTNKASSLLAAATSGLSYVSETDSPVEPVQDPVPKVSFGPAEARSLLGRPKGDPVEELSVADFFADLTQQEDWHGPKESQRVKQYRALVAVLNEQLQGSRGFRVGKVRVSILFVGRTSDGRWVGAKMDAVET